MYESVFDDSIDDEELSALENFVSLNNLIAAGGAKSERAKKIINQFSSTSTSKVPREISAETTSLSKVKRPKFHTGKRFKKFV